jgi:hypothetical protein
VFGRRLGGRRIAAAVSQPVFVGSQLLGNGLQVIVTFNLIASCAASAHVFHVPLNWIGSPLDVVPIHRLGVHAVAF